jgi:NitT/TauT family transport system permease protein
MRDAPVPRGISRTVSLLVLVVLWWMAAAVASSPQLLPGPLPVLSFAWHEILDGTLPWNAVVDPWVVIALNLPLLVVVVLTYVWVGLNDTAAILAVAIAKAPTVFVTVREGTRALDRGLEEVGMIYRLPRARRLRRIELPQLMPFIAAAARSGLSITWKIVLVVELLGRPNGIGFVLNLYFQNFNVTGILAYGLSFAAIMLIVETTVLQPWEWRTNAWRRDA